MGKISYLRQIFLTIFQGSFWVWGQPMEGGITYWPFVWGIHQWQQSLVESAHNGSICNAIFHWLSPYPEWSLFLVPYCAQPHIILKYILMIRLDYMFSKKIPKFIIPPNFVGFITHSLTSGGYKRAARHLDFLHQETSRKPLGANKGLLM